MKNSKLVLSVLVAALSSTGLVGCGGGDSSTPPTSSNNTPIAQTPTLTAQNYSITRAADDPNLDDSADLESMAMNIAGEVLVAVPFRGDDLSGYALRRLSGGTWQTIDEVTDGRQVQIAADDQGGFIVVDLDRSNSAVRVRQLAANGTQLTTKVNQIVADLQAVKFVQVAGKAVVLLHHWEARPCVGKCRSSRLYDDVLSVATLENSQTSLSLREVWRQAVDTNTTVQHMAVTADTQGQINVAWIARPTEERSFNHVWVAAVHADGPATIRQVLSEQIGVSQLKLLSAGTDQVLVAVQQVRTTEGDPRLYAQSYLSQTVEPVGTALTTDESTEDMSIAAQRLSNGSVRLVWSNNIMSLRNGENINTGELYQTIYRPNEQQFNQTNVVTGSKVERSGGQQQFISLSVNRLGEQISFFDENTQVARFTFNQNVNTPSLTAQRSSDLLAVVRGAPVLAAAHPEGCSAALMWRHTTATLDSVIVSATPDAAIIADETAVPIQKGSRGYYVSVLNMPAGVGGGCR